MKYRNVGRSGLKISEIALGSWMTQLKDSKQEEVAAEVVRAAFKSGVNFFDCADAYSGGDAERFLGRILKVYPRNELVVASKVFFPRGDGVNERGLAVAVPLGGGGRDGFARSLISHIAPHTSPHPVDQPRAEAGDAALPHREAGDEEHEKESPGHVVRHERSI